jgi:hypothetical protein
MAATLPPETPTAWELADRGSVQAFRAGRYLLIVAEGDLPTPGYDLDIQQSPIRIFPQHYNLVRRERPGIWPDVIVPYRYAEVVVYPPDQDAVTVHHRDGQDAVDIAACGEHLAQFAAVVAPAPPEQGSPSPVEATGMSPNLSFDEAFANAMANLPEFTAPHPDALGRVEVVEIGGLFGGFAGFHHLFVRVRNRSD